MPNFCLETTSTPDIDMKWARQYSIFWGEGGQKKVLWRYHTMVNGKWVYGLGDTHSIFADGCLLSLIGKI